MSSIIPFRGKDATRPNLAVMARLDDAVLMEGALGLATRDGFKIPSNKRLSQALIGSTEWKGIREALPCWSSTMTGYIEPGLAFGHEIAYSDPYTGIRYVFPVPEKFRGAKDALLVSEHPDYRLDIDGNDRIVRAARVDIIEKFPMSDGWYASDAEHDIPYGDMIPGSSPGVRYLWRTNRRVGLVGRCLDTGVGDVDVDDARRLLLNIWPSYPFGVVVEIDESGWLPACASCRVGA